MGRVIIAGASLAGVRTAQALRRMGFDGEVELIGSERHLPYDRPDLSKRFLAGLVDGEDLEIVADADLASLGIEVSLGDPAASVDLGARTVSTVSGRSVPFDRLVVATGAAPLVPDSMAGIDGVSPFRTIAHAALVRDELTLGRRVVVVGGGFIGAEIASTARGMGCHIALVEALGAPMERVVGTQIGQRLAALHLDNGVALHLGRPVRDIVRADGALKVGLEGGTEIQADRVVLALGVRPCVGWLHGSGLQIADGVRCNAVGRAVGAEGVVHAVGDVASWYHSRYNGHVRVEHWTNATDQANVVAADLLGAVTDSVAPLPYFWSDQYGRKIQMFGRPGPSDTVSVVRGDLDSCRFVALYHRGGVLTAALGIGMPRDLMGFRQQVLDQVAVESDREPATSA